MSKSESLILVGMPGAGKSTVGVLLAKELAMDFVDTDLLIQAREGKALQDILHASDYQQLREVEERTLLSQSFEAQVVATGGSAVYSEAAMRHLRRFGRVVYLHVPLDVLRQRLHNYADRGVARRPGQTLEELYEERCPLYERYADLRIECGTHNQDEVVAQVIYAEGEGYAEMDA